MDIHTQIEQLVDLFDTDRIYAVMTFLQWKWVGSDSENGIPSSKEIKDEARRLLKEAYDNVTNEGDTFTIACGGVRAFCQLKDGKYFLELLFELTDVNSHWLED